MPTRRGGEDQDGEDFWPFADDPSGPATDPATAVAPARTDPALPARPQVRRPGETVLPTRTQAAGSEWRPGAVRRPAVTLPGRSQGRRGRPDRADADPTATPSRLTRVGRGGDGGTRRWGGVPAQDVGLLVLALVVLALVVLAVA